MRLGVGVRETRGRFACRDELQGVAAGPDLSRPTSTPWQASVLREGEIGLVLVAQTRRQPAQQWKAAPDCGLRLEFASTGELEHTPTPPKCRRGRLRSFSDAEGGEDQIEDVVGRGLPGQGVQGPKRAIEIEQDHLVRDMVLIGRLGISQCGNRSRDRLMLT